MPILVFLGLSVLELGPMYATDRRQTKASLNASAPWGRRHNENLPFGNAQLTEAHKGARQNRNGPEQSGFHHCLKPLRVNLTLDIWESRCAINKYTPPTSYVMLRMRIVNFAIKATYAHKNDQTQNVTRVGKGFSG